MIKVVFGVSPNQLNMIASLMPTLIVRVAGQQIVITNVKLNNFFDLCIHIFILLLLCWITG